MASKSSHIAVQPGQSVINNMPQTNVKVIADSISESGYRITSIECHYPRFIHAEMLRHGLFHARSVSSSRAISTKLLIEQVATDPVIPLKFGKNQPGMVADNELDDDRQDIAKQIWIESAQNAARQARTLMKYDVHKQHVNRLLEPFIQVHELITATSWQNFLQLRLANNAQPEIQELANQIQDALASSQPKLLANDEWHLPYITDEIRKITAAGQYSLGYISAALCAKLSYSTYSHEQRMAESRETLGNDEWLRQQHEFANKLLENKHLTPFEHVAIPITMGWNEQFYGWQSLRNILRGHLEKN